MLFRQKCRMNSYFFRSRFILFVKKGILSYIVTCWFILLSGKGMNSYFLRIRFILLLGILAQSFTGGSYFLWVNSYFFKWGFILLMCEFILFPQKVWLSYFSPKKYELTHWKYDCHTFSQKSMNSYFSMCEFILFGMNSHIKSMTPPNFVPQGMNPHIDQKKGMNSHKKSMNPHKKCMTVYLCFFLMCLLSRGLSPYSHIRVCSTYRSRLRN